MLVDMLSERMQAAIAVVAWVASSVFTYLLIKKARELQRDNERIADERDRLKKEIELLREENRELIELKLRELDIDA